MEAGVGVESEERNEDVSSWKTKNPLRKWYNQRIEEVCINLEYNDILAYFNVWHEWMEYKFCTETRRDP